jgi:aspartate-semialdehyde dehydrogenase
VVKTLDETSFEGVDVALFSAGGSISKEYGPIAAEAGAIVVDNSSAFRQDDDVPLVVPEVNRHAIAEAFTGRGIIANPNCSTIQMVVALKPLHDSADLRRVVVSTYQSVSGAGRSGINELLDGTRALVNGGEEPPAERFAHPIAFNAVPHIDVFLDNGFTREEMKMVWETRKIMELPDLQISATCVRVPVIRAHSEAVTAEFASEMTADKARGLLLKAPGVTVVDKPSQAAYPLARNADGLDETFVGRIRDDLDKADTIHMWVVSDNLRKGAATNAVQIVEALIEDGHLDQ